MGGNGKGGEMKVVLDGKAMIGTVMQTVGGIKTIGLMVAPTDQERPVNTTDQEWGVGRIVSDDEACIILIPNLESARVLQDRINLIVLELNGYEVTK
jgi:hypothetical protein